MLKKALLSGICLLALTLSAEANQFSDPDEPTHASSFWPRGIGGGSICPYGTGTGDNGCSGANQNGSYQDTNLINSAQQTGQNSLLPLHAVTANGIVPFNMPGQDYPVGYDKTLTLKDPRTIINDGVCQWAATFLDCSSIGSGVVNEVLDGYDFSGTTIGKGAVGIWAPNSHVSAGSTLTITNSKFSLIPATGTAEVSVGGNFSNFVFKYNQCDGASADSASGFCFDSAATVTGSWDIEYNAFTNQGVGRVAGGLTNASWTFKYNFVQGLNDLNTSNHGEIMLRNCSGGRANCTAFDDYEGNFIIWDPVAFTGGNGDNATVFPGDGASDGVTLTSFTYNQNVVVTNTSISGGLQPDQAMFNSRLAIMGTVNMNKNWTDAHGSNGCSISGVKSGGDTVTAQASGGVVTITGLSGSFGNNPIETKWQFWRGGVLWGTITSMGTSVGNTGTVNVDNAATVPSDSSWTLVPGFTSLTANDNFNLNDPSHTGVAAAMNISGPQFVAGTCTTG